MSIALIIPSFGHFSYVRKTVLSFFEHTPGNDNVAYIIDDGSPGWNSIDWTCLWPPHIHVPPNMPHDKLMQLDHSQTRQETGAKVLCYRFTRNHGLTRSWNMGLRLGWKSATWRADYVVCGNSDILFTPKWDEYVVGALDTFDLVGPSTNAPGRVFQQNVTNFYKGYKLTDDPSYLADAATKLQNKYGGRVFKSWRVNGFFMAAKSDVWWQGAYNNDYVFNPAERMDNGAYELQARWRRRKFNIGIVPSSFIFHYRSVSRGPRGLRGACGRGAWRPPKQAGEKTAADSDNDAG